ncbi:MAG: TssQ family T6SS-associated lipoprotein [Burkholderiaceae bacterium]
MNRSRPIPHTGRTPHATHVLPALLALCGALLVGCATPPAPPPGLMDVAARPAEKALLAAMRAYDDARYPQSERLLDQALQTGLVSPKDRAAAHKYLAFIYCTSERIVECEAAFRAARAADPGFGLSKAERGHPLWGPVYARAQQR